MKILGFCFSDVKFKPYADAGRCYNLVSLPARPRLHSTEYTLHSNTVKVLDFAQIMFINVMI